MILRARHVAALGLCYALSLSCSDDDDDAAQPSAGAGGKNAQAGQSGGTSKSGASPDGGSTGDGGGNSSNDGGSGQGAPIGGLGSGGVGTDAPGQGGEGDGGVIAAGAPGMAGASGDTGSGGAGGAPAALEYDFSCVFPTGTPCFPDVPADTTWIGQLTGPGELEVGRVYVISILSDEDVDLKVCGSSGCQGDHACESSSAGGDERCVLQASEDFLSVFVTNHAGTTKNVRVDMDNDAVSEFQLSYVQMTSSLGPYAYRRFMVTGLTPQTTYEFHVQTANSRPVSLVVSSDLHAQQVLCDEDLVGTAASCQVAVTAPTMWALITDTSGIGDGYTFKVTSP